MRKASINMSKLPVKNNVTKNKVVVAPWTNTVASDTEIKKRRIRATKLKEIGVDVYSVDGASEHENPYRAEAVMLITNDKEVPKELKEKIKKYDTEHKNKKMKKDKQIVSKV